MLVQRETNKKFIHTKRCLLYKYFVGTIGNTSRRFFCNTRICITCNKRHLMYSQLCVGLLSINQMLTVNTTLHIMEMGTYS